MKRLLIVLCAALAMVSCASEGLVRVPAPKRPSGQESMIGFAAPEGEIDIENLNAHSFVPEDVREQLMQVYKHPLLQYYEEQARKVGGHCGMDFTRGEWNKVKGFRHAFAQ